MTRWTLTLQKLNWHEGSHPIRAAWLLALVASCGETTSIMRTEAGGPKVGPTIVKSAERPNRLIVSLRESAPALTGKDGSRFCPCTNPYRLWVSLDCGPGKHPHVLAENRLVTNHNGEWWERWPAECEPAAVEPQVSFLVNYRRSPVAMYYQFISKLTPDGNDVIIQLTVPCYECNCGDAVGG